MTVEKKPIVPFSPEDLKRRRKRSIVLALCLAALMVLFFVNTIVKIWLASHGAGQ